MAPDTVKASKTEAPKGTFGAGNHQAKHIIIATGARPRGATRPGARQKAGLDILRSHGARPRAKSLLVVGSGAIGMEFASFYRNGAPVPKSPWSKKLCADFAGRKHRIYTFARKSFEKQGIKDSHKCEGRSRQKKCDSKPWPPSRRAGSHKPSQPNASFGRGRRRQYRKSRP